MRNKEVISYLGLWESIHNDNFKGGEFATFKNEAEVIHLRCHLKMDKRNECYWNYIKIR